MPKVSELRESKYIKKEDCPLILTISHLENENVAVEGKTDMRWVLYFNENDKGLIMNITNGTIMADNFGTEEMDEWVGKRIELYNDKNVMYAGKRVGGVRVKPTEPSIESVNKDIQEADKLNKGKAAEDDDDFVPL